MCGITGYVGEREAAPIVIDGLSRLEYRGYDSVGIAVLEKNGGLAIHKRAGKLGSFASEVTGQELKGRQGIGHTRWATHGKPTDLNAHPHTDCTGNVVVIHNGIVENHAELKQRLVAEGHTFRSETDTEVIPHLIELFLAEGDDLNSALIKTIQQIRGAHAILAMSLSEPGTIVAARVGNAGGVVIEREQRRALRAHLSAEVPVADHGERVRDHGYAQAVLLDVLRIRVVHQPPTLDEFHPGQVREEMTHQALHTPTR